MYDTAPIELGTSPAGVYLTAVLSALAREERKGKKPKRLIEPGQATWDRFRGRMGVVDFVDLLLEDAAVTQPEPFDPVEVIGLANPSEMVPEAALAALVASLAGAAQEPEGREYLDLQAASLGLAARLAFSDLPKVDEHPRVLELPGTGGRLSAHLVQSRPGLASKFKEGFTIACASWQERLLAGLVAVELAGKPTILVDPDLSKARAMGVAFTHVIGLRPEKGGAFDEHQVRALFPDAKVTDIKLV